MAVDDRNEKIGYKIREGQIGKVPYLLVVGDKEVESGCVAVRQRGKGEAGVVPANLFVADLVAEIAAKA